MSRKRGKLKRPKSQKFKIGGRWVCKLSPAAVERFRAEVSSDIHQYGNQFSCPINRATTMQTAEVSINRDDDGDVCLDIYIDKDNTVSISVHPSGVINWAGTLNGKPRHAHVATTELGAVLFDLLDRCVEPAET